MNKSKKHKKAFTYPRDRLIYIFRLVEDDDFVQSIIERLNDLACVSNEPIYIIINSEGGLKIQCYAICDAIRTLGVPVYTIVQGQAFSTAAFIFLAGEKRYITKLSSLMFHYNRLGGLKEDLIGAPELKYYTKRVRRVGKELIAYIMEATGLKKKKVKKLMAKEKELTAKEAVKLGFAHMVI